MFGFTYFRSITLRGNKYDFAIISKKDCRRPGKRFIVRGLDKEGNPTNHVETESIIAYYEANDIKVATYV